MSAPKAKKPVEARVYEPNASAVPFHESSCRVKAICGPVGSGKSTVAIMDFFMLCHEATVPIRGLVLRETYRQLTDSTRRTWDDWFKDCSRYIKQDERMEITIPGADGIVRTHFMDFRHARRVEDATAFLSTEYAYIWMEEPVPAFEIGSGVIGGGIPEAVFNVALTRLRQSGVHRRHVVLTFNPPNKFHWIYKKFFEATPAHLEDMDFALFRQPPRENSKHLQPGYYDTLSKTLDPVLVQRFVEGEPVTLYPGVRVYPDCHDEVHIVEGLVPDEHIPLVTGHDWGLTPVVIYGQIMPSGQIRVYKETQLWNSGAKRLAEQMSRDMHTDFSGFKIGRSWGDPAGASRAESDENTCFSVMAQAGFPVAPGAITFQERREQTTHQFRRMVEGKPAILIDSQGCPLLAEALMGGN